MHSNSLHIATKGDLNALDPHSLNETFSIGILGNVMEGLTRRDKNLKTIPGLAVSWQALSPKHWRFFLRRGVKFHDGSPFGAEDVVFTFQRAMHQHSQMKVRVPVGTRIVKVDEYTVDFILERPNPILISDWDSLYIMSKTWAVRHGMAEPLAATARISRPAALTANGTGPFHIVSHLPGMRTVFALNTNWWGQAEHNLTKVILSTVKSSATRVGALLARQVDVIVPAPVEEISWIDAVSYARSITAPELRTIFLNLDSLRKQLLYSDVKGKNPFSDIRVRKAIYQAIDIEALRDKIMRGFSKPSALLISPKLFHLSSEFKRYPFDVAAARSLMKDAGYENGFSIIMDCPNNRYVNDEAICIAIINMLAKINLITHVFPQCRQERLISGFYPANGGDVDGAEQGAISTRLEPG